MKQLIFGVFALTVILASCSKVDQPIPATSGPSDPYSLYPYGDSAHYAQNAWPTFTANTNTDRNILVEDYTGHKCGPCAYVGEFLHDLILANQGRVVGVAIHAGPNGTGSLQETTLEYPTIFYNDISDALGNYFGSGWPSSGFSGNPQGAVSRIDHGSGSPLTHPSNWENAVNSMIAANDFKVNMQAASNYYPTTNGLFLHTEIEVDASVTNELRIVAYFVQDSVIAPQYTPTGIDPLYVHRDILRAALDGKAFGQELDAAHLDANGKYYFNYIYEVPDGYNNTNSHVVLFVRDAVTEEVYQVIKHEF